MTDKKKTNLEYVPRYNTWTEKWERKIKGDGHEWEEYNRVPDPDAKYDDDMNFIRMWLKTVKKEGSCSDVSRYYCETIRSVQARRRAINKKLVKELNLAEGYETLPSLPGLTQTQKNHRDSHYKPRPKILTLAEKLETLPESLYDVLNLPKPKSAK